MNMATTARLVGFLIVSGTLLLFTWILLERQSPAHLTAGEQIQEERRLLTRTFFQKRPRTDETRQGTVRKKAPSYFTEDERTKDLQRKGSYYNSLIRRSEDDRSYYLTSKKGKGSTKFSRGKGKYGKGGNKKGETMSCAGSERGKGKRSNSDFSLLGMPTSCDSFDFADMSSSPVLPFDGARSNNCNPNVLQQLANLPQMSTFLHLIAMADLTCILHCGGPFTVLAPANEAFLGLDPYEFAEITQPQNRHMLQELVLRHILPGRHMSPDLQPGLLGTLASQNTEVTLDPPMFDQANVVYPDNQACNGVIHGIDDILGARDGGKYHTSIVSQL